MLITVKKSEYLFTIMIYVYVHNMEQGNIVLSRLHILANVSHLNHCIAKGYLPGAVLIEVHTVSPSILPKVAVSQLVGSQGRVLLYLF